MDIRKLQRAIVDGLEDVKAQDIAVFNTEHLSALFERVVIATGTSNRQTKALASSVRTSVKEAGFPVPRTEGEDNGEWIIVDCGQAVVHVMQPAIRQYYQLEEIWGEKPVALKAKATRTGLVKASEPMDEAPVKPKKASGKTTAARKAATTPPEAKKAPAKKAAAKPVKAAEAKPAASKKVAVKKAASKTTAVSKSAAAKPMAAKKVAAKKVVAKKAATVKKVVVNAPEKKTPARKTVAVKKVAAKKVAVKKVVAVKTVAAKKAATKKAAR